jgi:MATE family multidrug resistance protein
MQITHRRILTIAVPIVLANATVPLLGAVDTFVVGQIASPIPIGAVAIGSLIISAFYWFFGFLRMGTTGLTSQAVGSKDISEVAAILTRVLFAGVLAGVLILALQPLLFWAAFALSPASSEVESLARTYLQVRVLTAPAAIALFGLNGWLIAQERTKEVLVLQLAMNGLNIGLDLLFVLSFGWGVQGVAVASIIAEACGVIIGLWMCRGALQSAAGRAWDVVFARSKLIRMFTVNIDILFRTLMIETTFVSFTFLAARFGDVPLAANHVLLQFFVLTVFALDGFAFAVEALVGQAFGSKDKKALRQSAIKCSQWGLGAAFVMSFCFAVGGSTIIGWITKSPEVQTEALRYLPYLVATPFFCLAPFMLDGIYLGATRTWVMRNTTAFSLVCYGIAVVTLIPYFENHGLWMALLISFLARGIALAWLYPDLEASLDKA